MKQYVKPPQWRSGGRSCWIKTGPFAHGCSVSPSREHLLLVTLHHIAADAWSMTLLANEVAVFYQAEIGRAGHTTDALPPLSVQYADFAHWQRQRLQGPVLDAHLTYWKQRLGVNPPVLKLPTDRPRPAVQSFPRRPSYLHGSPGACRPTTRAEP